MSKLDKDINQAMRKVIALKNRKIMELHQEIARLNDRLNDVNCPHCDTTELLCGYPRHCTSDSNPENQVESYPNRGY